MSGGASGKSVVVIGKNGQLARALGRIDAIAGKPVVCLGRPELDLAQFSTIAPAVTAARPAVVINAAAYTAVERAETERELAYAVNAGAVEHLARVCAGESVPFITLSTDYVFDGSKASPYVEDDPICPINVYGASKAEGEDRTRRIASRHLIFRTSWVYSWEGRNFLLAMADRVAKRAETKVVTDQTGSPTYAEDIANAICEVTEKILAGGRDDIWGTYHMTNRGTTNWFGFATEIFSNHVKTGIKVPPLFPVTSAEFPSKVKRPVYSVLDTTRLEQKLSIALPHWRDALARCMKRLQEIGP
jgi:dTDP-4-dehydrorhamnose reductase